MTTETTTITMPRFEVILERITKVKTGDNNVYLQICYGSIKQYKKLKVEKVLKHKFVCKIGETIYEFNARGTERNEEYCPKYMIVLTDKEFALHEQTESDRELKNKLVNEIRETEFKYLTLDQLKVIKSIIG